MSEGTTSQERVLFGTDGIRGQANLYPMTADLVLKLGQAAGRIFKKGDHRHTVVIGKDTRLSGYLFESALQAGLTSVGVNCVLVGPLPTPAIAFLTRSLRADAGVMISASHNPFYDNGIKFFDSNGMKLPDSTELEIERMLLGNGAEFTPPAADRLGRASRIENIAGRYIEFCKNSFPRNLRLDGLRVVVDCAHGAAYRVAPQVFWELGADVITLGNAPNGTNINDHVGALHPQLLQEKVREVRADIGIALDGDADRVMVCDEKTRLHNGDSILAMCALAMQRNHSLRGDGVVATVMSNLGLERWLESHGLKLIRAKVGDRYVLEEMQKNGYNLGGEQSGHLIFLDHNTTGDGIISGLKVLELMASTQRPLSELAAGMETLPQVLKNVTVPLDSNPMDNPGVVAAITEVAAELGKAGRVLVRKSGTEPKIRVMVEGDSLKRIENYADRVCQAIKGAAAGG